MLLPVWIYSENKSGDEDSDDENVIKVKLRDGEEQATIGKEQMSVAKEKESEKKLRIKAERIFKWEK